MHAIDMVLDLGSAQTKLSLAHQDPKERERKIRRTWPLCIPILGWQDWLIKLAFYIFQILKVENRNRKQYQQINNYDANFEVDGKKKILLLRLHVIDGTFY